MVIRYRRADDAKRPELEFEVEILSNGTLRLRAEVPDELESKVMVAMRNSLEKKCLKEGVLEILLPCLRKSSPDEKERKLKAFCRWLTQRSDVDILAVI